MSKTILVNGGVGFIGHHLCTALSRMGHTVIAVDRMQQLVDSPKASLFRQYIDERLSILKDASVQIEYADTADDLVYNKLLARVMPDVIYHMSAIANARICNVDPHAGITENLVKVEKVLELVRTVVPNARLVFASSSVAYGHFKHHEVKENDPLEPINIYGFTKKASEELIRLYASLYGIEYAIVRPSALYGPRCVNERISQIIIEKYFAGQPITILGDGEERLDFTFVEDTVQGFILAGLHERAKNEIFNITYGQSRSINELLRIAQQHLPDMQIQYVPRDNVMPFRGTLNIDKAREYIGYQPQYPLEKGYPNYITWYLQHKEIFNL